MQGPVGIVLTGVDRGPRRGVHDGVGCLGPDGGVHGLPVADVEAVVVEAHDVMAGEGGDELGADLPAGAGDEDLHGVRTFMSRGAVPTTSGCPDTRPP